MHKKIIIAIDGYSSCGKSTVAKALAKQLDYIYIDTGAMYRAVTYFFLKNKINIHDPNAVRHALEICEITFNNLKDSEHQETFLNGENIEKEIRSLYISDHVSEISKVPVVREIMTQKQRNLGKKKGVVMDGRDIGSAVFPEAELKIFMTAEKEIRAMRRYEEIKNSEDTSLDEVRNNIELRDFNDTNRGISPLRKSNDAITLDNSYMSQREQLEWLYKLVQNKINE